MLRFIPTIARLTFPNAVGARLRAVARRLLLGIAGLVFSLGMAHAAKGLVAGAEMQGYGRIVFSFEGVVEAKARVVNSVLIVDFDQPIAVDLEKLSAQLPSYISVVRADPDGRSVRFGLNDRFRVDVKMAGERVYLDILAAAWKGLPPSLPPEVVQDLVRRARAAEDALRKLEQDREKKVSRALEISVANAPQFRRVIIKMPRTAPNSFNVKDGAAALIFDANFTLAEDMTRQRLAGLIKDLDIEPGAESLRVTLVAQDGMDMRAFREDDTITIDFSRKDGKLIDDVSKPATPAPPPKVGAPKAGAATPAAQPAPQKRAEAMPAAVPPKAPVPPQSLAQAPAATALVAASPALQAAIAQADAAPELALESGRDPQGFALRLRRLGSTAVAIIQRGNSLLALIETADRLRAPAIEGALKEKVSGLNISARRGAMLVRLDTPAKGAFWLRREGADLLIERGQTEGSPEAFSGGDVTLVHAYDDVGHEALEAKLGTGGTLHMIDDPATGQKIALVGAPDARYRTAKPMKFSEFSLEPTLSGFAVQPLDEALTLKRRPESLLIGHEIKLNLSALPSEPERVADRGSRLLMLDLESWSDDQRGDIRETEHKLLRSAAEAPRVTRTAARLRLARFYMANALYPEAEAVLKVLVADDQPASANKQVIYYRAFVAAMMGHSVEATQLLTENVLSTEGERRLIQAYVDAKGLRYPRAVKLFKDSTLELDRYPEALQARFRRQAIQAAIETGDPVFARDQLLAYEKLASENRDPHLQQLLAARLAEQQDRPDDALAAYTLAAQSRDRGIEAEARFGKASTALAMSKIAPEDARAEFETVAIMWRRTETEVKALEKLGEFYAREGRWREAFLASQRATAIMPDHVAARRLEDSMARRFENLFLKGEGDKLSKIETLAIYQEFRQLVPVGRRGDEIARRLAERLNDLDLSAEATAILEHQMKNRLEGVARAAVATRLAVLYLTNRQPMQALAALRGSRLATLPEDLRRPRQLLEARALGDLARTDLAIEMVADEQGEDVDRLRADIFWKGKKWREAGETYERLLGDTWQEDAPLKEGQRLDALRAGLAYTLGDEKLSLDRLRGRYLAPMSKTEDGGSFNLVTSEKFNRPEDFRAVARTIVNADTMTEFMSAYRKRYPESGGKARPVRSAGDGKQSAAEKLPAPGAPMPGAG